MVHISRKAEYGMGLKIGNKKHLSETQGKSSCADSGLNLCQQRSLTTKHWKRLKGFRWKTDQQRIKGAMQGPAQSAQIELSEDTRATTCDLVLSYVCN